MNSYLRRIPRVFLLPLVRRAAQVHVVGSRPADALRVCRQLSRRGLFTAVGYWERRGESPRKIADAHLAAAELVVRQQLNCYISIKIPPLAFHPQLMAEVARRSSELGVRLHLDSTGPEWADQTFSLIDAVSSPNIQLGCTLPSRWRRSLYDADLAVERQLHVRVVKGQWADKQQPKTAPRVGFMAIIDRLAGRARHVAVATHDPPLAREALRRLQSANTPCELELLPSLPTKAVLDATRQFTVPVRVYVPYGHPYLPYPLSDAWSNPRIVWYLLYNLLVHSEPEVEFRTPGDWA